MIEIGWTIALLELEETIPTLWSTVKSFMKEYPELVPKNNLMDFVSNDGGYSYNLCHLTRLVDSFTRGNNMLLERKVSIDGCSYDVC